MTHMEEILTNMKLLIDIAMHWSIAWSLWGAIPVAKHKGNFAQSKVCVKLLVYKNPNLTANIGWREVFKQMLFL